jgi:DNA-directed RNA polymerase specialized sigma24 family protein
MLAACARRLAGADAARAEDLLQDAYIQFTLARPDLGAIENLDGYLVRLLRNLHLSSIRRQAAGSARTVPIESFDSAELALNGLDPEQRTRARDQLRRVCHYVCRRKAHSKAASVLALRFFLGFYPAEIGRILITTPVWKLDVLVASCTTSAEPPSAISSAPAFRSVSRGR